MGLVELYRLIWRGSFPAIATEGGMDRDLILRLLPSDLLNVTDLARDAGVAFNTAKSWLSILQSSGIVTLLEAFHSNLTKRLVKAPKLCFLDTGLCAYLTQWSSPETLEAGAMSGAFL